MWNQRQQLKRQALLEERAHSMRHQPTPSEAKLWEALRGGPLGVSFRRQVRITTCTQSINSVGANALVARIYAKELGICGEGRTYGTGNASETICRFLDMGRELCVLAFHASRFPNSRGIFPDALVCGSAASSLRACKSGNCAAHCEEWFVGSSCG